MGEVVGIFCVVGMLGSPAAGSAHGRGGSERVREATLGELDFESVFALGLGAAHCRFRRLAEVGGVGRLADERGFGLGRSPWLGADAAQRDAGPSDVSAGDGEYDRGG